LFLQVLPGSAESSVDKDNLEFEHLSKIAETISTEELTGLPVEQVLYRLFHDEAVRLFDAQPVQFKCTCSKERSASALKSIDKAELLDIVAEQGKISMNCQYCNTEYSYDSVDVEAIHAGSYSTDKPLQ